MSAGLRFRSQHLRRVWAPLWQIFPQFAIVAFEAVALLVRRRTGGFAAVPTLGASGSDDPVGRGERVFLAYFDTLSPNDYVVDVDRRRKLALRHIFVREHETELP